MRAESELALAGNLGRENDSTDLPTAIPGVVTRKSLADALVAMGIGKGEVVLVHASLSSLGFAVGGSVAVVQALLDAVGSQGTVVVPTFTAGNSDPSRWARTRGAGVPDELWPTIREHLPGFDARTTPSENMGRIAETVRTWPGSVRSAHPQTSFAAVGASAAELMRSHPRDCHLGPGTPMARLVTAEAKVLLLGVSYSVCSAFHLAEYLRPDPPTRKYECVVFDDESRRWHTYTDVDLRDDDFGKLGLAMEASAAGTQVRRALVGAATLRLVPARVCVDFAPPWLTAHRPSSGRPAT
jgi:aminoglycoside 3-N-acetyltransferase